jgi:hypothetical protein
MDDVDLFFPEPVCVKTRAGEVAILPLVLDQMQAYFRAVKPIANQVLQGEYLLAASLHPEACKEVIAASTALTPAQIGRLHGDDIIRLLETIIFKVNRDFMDRAVLPTLREVSAERVRMGLATAVPQADGPPSSPISDGAESDEMPSGA